MINMKNEDEMCFKWSFLRGLNMVSNHPERITRDLFDKGEEFDWSCVLFPTKRNEIGKFERRNNVSINVFGWDGYVFPLKIVKEEKERHVDLLLLKKDEKSHFCVVKNFSRLVSLQKKKGNRAIFP